MTAHDLPPINASLNAVSAGFILLGWWQIKHGHQRLHIAAMACALASSTLFLLCYVIYHFFITRVTHFKGIGFERAFYFALLGSHTLLASVTVPLVLMTAIAALRAHFEKHRRLAHWALPIWLYVSVTGVLVYLMLYRW